MAPITGSQKAKAVFVYQSSITKSHEARKRRRGRKYLFIYYLLKIFKEGDLFSHSCFTRGSSFNYEHIQCKI